MAYIPKGKYLTVEQYRRRIGYASRRTVIDAINNGRLSAIWLDKKTPIIPEDAIMENRTLKSGKYVGVRAWIRGEIEHQEELEEWEKRQRQLRKLREKDGANDN